ncbi:hemolysin family protein [Gordonia sp. (in: high G+C Gram-positive bacteria)]|uniref:hemolysin family protein n=1 Tax=unclassified Gordonia (in: high G+C Gram-positive bacteria) TaxID=2657482 RepID=UPI0026163BBD|nr:hemolysin family protein [Gordonia sp. (in: high G+C Gram-positive bacteria)]
MVRDIAFLGVAALLTVLAGAFAAIDSALSTVSAARVEDLVRGERGGARRLLRVIEQRSTYLGLTVLLRIGFETASTVLVAILATDALGLTWGIVVAVLAMTVVSFVAVGVGPRTVGRQHAYSIALVAAPVLTALGVLLRPVTRVLIVLGNAVTPGRGFRNGPFATEVEVREVVDLAQSQGVVDDDERRMIQSVFELDETNAREVMVPRPEMVWIEDDKSATQALSLAVRSGHSRIPVIGENPDDVLGVIYLKDIVERMLPQGTTATDLTAADLMREAWFVPDSKRLDDLLEDMQAQHNHMAMLVDEYGGIAGLVTIEDVLEEIVGEITDEYDTDEVAPIEELSEGVYRVSSRLPVEDLGELYDVELGDDEVETVGGLLAWKLGRVPLPGSRVKIKGLLLTAEGGPNRVGRQRITSVLVRKHEKRVKDPDKKAAKKTKRDKSAVVPEGEQQ